MWHMKKSDQPGHPCSQIISFAVCMRLLHPRFSRGETWTSPVILTDGQADVSFHWLDNPEDRFFYAVQIM